MKKYLIYLCGASLIFATSCGKGSTPTPTPVPPVTPPVAPVPPVTAVSYLSLAKETHEFVKSNLLTSSYSYRANTTSHASNCYEWYNVSQIYADAAMVEAGDASYLPYMNSTFKFMENIWDKADARGGYFGAVNLDGSGAAGDKFVDDNGLTGMVYLEASEITAGTDKQAYFDKAKACADWLINSELWDTTYGGGFWWTTAKTFKPTQANGVALQLFTKLYKITGSTEYRDWAVKVDNWLINNMYDSTTGLYIWKIDGSGAGTKHTEKFTYDNAVMVEANILYSQAMNNDAYLTKAQNLGNAMNKTLWNATYKGYIFNTGAVDGRINPAWCAWGSQGMIRLYEADHNAKWLTYAKDNINRLNIATRNTTTHGYYFFATFDGTNRSSELETVDQAWMQRVQALMAKYQ